jgi:uncharacterized protein YciI
MTGPPVQQILFYDYVEDYLTRRTEYRADHLAHAERWKQEGKLEHGGTLHQPPTGALFVFLVDDPAVVADFIAGDPYVLNGLVTEHRVVPWTVAI